jgi:hypothetical protein
LFTFAKKQITSRFRVLHMLKRCENIQELHGSRSDGWGQMKITTPIHWHHPNFRRGFKRCDGPITRFGILG